MDSLPIISNPQGVSFAVRVIPRSSRSGISQVRQGQLTVYLSAPPVEGAANQALVKVLAKALGVAPTRLEIINGSKNRSKVVRVSGLTEESVRQSLAVAGTA